MIRNLNFLALVIYGVFLRLQKPTLRTTTLRDWELGLYKYANVSMLVSIAASVTNPHPPVPFLVRVRYRRDTYTFVYFSLSRSFFCWYSSRTPSIFRFITSLYQSSAFSALFYNNSGHCTEVILVCIFRAKCPPSPAMQRRSKSTETPTIRCTLRLNSRSSICGFGACQEMICIEERTPTVARDLGRIISKLQTFSTRVQRPSRERPKALSLSEGKRFFLRAMNTDNFSPNSGIGTEQTILIFWNKR